MRSREDSGRKEDEVEEIKMRSNMRGAKEKRTRTTNSSNNKQHQLTKPKI